MSHIYKITFSGITLSEPYEFLKSVFPQWNGEEACSDQIAVWVKFDSPQTPADLGPMVKVKEVPELFAP